MSLHVEDEPMSRRYEADCFFLNYRLTVRQTISFCKTEDGEGKEKSVP